MQPCYCVWPRFAACSLLSHYLGYEYTNLARQSPGGERLGRAGSGGKTGAECGSAEWACASPSLGWNVYCGVGGMTRKSTFNCFAPSPFSEERAWFYTCTSSGRWASHPEKGSCLPLAPPWGLEGAFIQTTACRFPFKWVRLKHGDMWALSVCLPVYWEIEVLF